MPIFFVFSNDRERFRTIDLSRTRSSVSLYADSLVLYSTLYSVPFVGIVYILRTYKEYRSFRSKFICICLCLMVINRNVLVQGLST